MVATPRSSASAGVRRAADQVHFCVYVAQAHGPDLALQDIPGGIGLLQLHQAAHVRATWRRRLDPRFTRACSKASTTRSRSSSGWPTDSEMMNTSSSKSEPHSPEVPDEPINSVWQVVARSQCPCLRYWTRLIPPAPPGPNVFVEGLDPRLAFPVKVTVRATMLVAPPGSPFPANRTGLFGN